MVELDLQLSRDRRLVVVHDWDLVRLAGSSLVVESEPWARLRGADVTAGFARRGRRWEPVPMPTLEEVLARLPPTLPLDLELKRRSAEPVAFAEALAGVLAGRPNLLLSSFDWGLLAEVERRLPGCPLAPLGDRAPRSLLAAARELGAAAVHCHRRIARGPLIEGAAAAGLPVLVYTVNQPSVARRLLERGVAGLFTDFPGRLRRRLALGRRPGEGSPQTLSPARQMP